MLRVSNLALAESTSMVQYFMHFCLLYMRSEHYSSPSSDHCGSKADPNWKLNQQQPVENFLAELLARLVSNTATAVGATGFLVHHVFMCFRAYHIGT